MIKQKPLKIAIASGKGGTGKTFVSTNLFFVAQNKGIKTCLVDCDAEEPNVLGFFIGSYNYKIPATKKTPVINKDKCTFCGKCKEYCQFNAIFLLPPAGFIQVTPELCHSCGACIVACKFDAISEINLPVGEITSVMFAEDAEIIESKINIGVERSGEIIKTAQKRVSDTYKLVLYDSPPGISCPLIATVENADIVLFVAEPTPFGLNDLKLSVEVLKTLGKPFFAIINKHGMGNDEVEQFLNDEGIDILAKIPYDKLIAQSYSVGEIISKINIKYANLFEQVLKKFDDLKIIKLTDF